LGTMTLVAADRHSNFADIVCSYALAEGISVGHDCVCLVPSQYAVEETLTALPFNLTYATDHPDDGGDTSKGAPAVNAASTASCTRYCCSYDLSRRLVRDHLVYQRVCMCAVCCVLCAVCCVLCAVCCVLCAVCYVLCAVCCVLCAECLLHVPCDSCFAFERVSRGR
jgi:hypothetical protein